MAGFTRGTKVSATTTGGHNVPEVQLDAAMAVLLAQFDEEGALIVDDDGDAVLMDAADLVNGSTLVFPDDMIVDGNVLHNWRLALATRGVYTAADGKNRQLVSIGAEEYAKRAAKRKATAAAKKAAAGAQV